MCSKAQRCGSKWRTLVAAMTDPSEDHILIPYMRFLECQVRRRAVAAALRTPTPPINDADTPAVPDLPPTSVSTAWSAP